MPKGRADSRKHASSDVCRIVGVGASAGGLEALRRLFGTVPADTPFTFVVVRHRDPSHPTRLPELLRSASPVPFIRAKDGDTIEGGRAYVVPEGRVANVEDGRLRLRQRSAHDLELPIDELLTSLARRSPGACAVLLSGQGSDGLRGLREIAASGGITFVQAPDSTSYAGAPRAAVEAGLADFVGSPEEIAKRLHFLAGHPNMVAGGNEGALAPETERSQAAELAQQSRTFDVLVSSVTDYLYMFDRDGRFVFANRMLLDLLGIPLAEVVGKSMRDLDYPPRMESILSDNVREVFETGAVVTSQTRYTSPTGVEGHFENVLAPIVDAQGETIMVAVSSRDVSERIAAARELAEAKQRLDAQIDNSPLAIVEFDAEKRIIRWSEEAEHVFGWSADEVLGKPMYEIPWIHPEDVGLVEKEDERLRTGTGRSVNLNRNVRKDGRVIWCEWYDSAVYDANGDMVSIFSQVLDITERRAAEQALRESEEKYRGLFTHLIDGFALHEIVLDDRGRPVDYVFLEANDAFGAMTGLEPDRIVGKRATEVLPGIENDPADWIGVYGDVALSGEPRKFEQRSDELDKWYSVSAYSPRRGLFVTVFEDVTARKRAEAALEESEGRVRHKLESLLSPEGDIGELDLSDILDVPAVQSLMEEFHSVTNIPMALIDLDGRVPVGVGWQDVCTKYHRVNPESCAHCIESDTVLTVGIPAGEVKVYKCRNGLRDVATPILVGGKHVGNLFTGQFFFDDELVDYDAFRAQARRYGFDEKEYIAALDAVPRLSRTQLDTGMRFLMKLSNMVSELSFSNIELARSVTERQRLADETLQQAEILNAINTVFHETLTSATMEELGRTCLSVARGLTDSAFGFINDLGEDGPLHDFAIDDRGWEACTMNDKSGHRKPPGDFELHGLYGDVVLRGESLFTNEPAEHPQSIGVPEGHPRLTSFLGVPLKDGGSVVGMIGVANRPGGYTPVQQSALEAIAPVVVEAMQRKRAEDALRESRQRVDQLARMLEVSSQPFAVASGDGELIDFNPAYEMLTGYSAEELRALSWRTDLTPAEWRGTDAWSMREQSANGGAPIRYEKEYLRKDGSRVPIEVIRNVHQDENGEIDFYYAFFSDLTERKRNEKALARTAERLALLADSARMLLTAEEPVDVVHKIAERVMAFLGCDAFFNYVIEDAEGMRLNAYAGIPAEEAEKVSRLGFGAAVCGCVGRDGERIVAEDIQHSDDDRTDLVRSWGIQAYACHPLLYQGGAIGTLSFGCKTRKAFSDEELELMRVVSDQAATAMARKQAEDRLRASREEISQLYERERKIADTLQEAILAPLPDIEGLESAYVYRPASATANVGGDFYDLFELDGSKVAIVVGDVSGKGIDAARLTSLLRDGIRAYALETSNPARTLERVNELVRRSSSVEAFATVFLGVLDLETGWLRYTAAGHPPVLVCGEDDATYLSPTTASIVGAFNEAKFGFGEAQVMPGQSLVLYTDGVLEARSGLELFGEDRLMEAVLSVRGESIEAMPQAIVDRVLDFAGGHLQDDTVVMCVRWTGKGSTSTE